MTIQKIERNKNLDILRLVACLLVVMSHVSSGLTTAIQTHSATWWIAHIYNTIGHTGTILFFFLSGCLLLSEEYDFRPRKFYTHNFLKLFVAYYTWIVIYHLVGFVQRGNWGIRYIKDVIINVIEGEASYHFWYLPMILGIYLILPMLRAICHHSRKLAVYFVLLFFFCKVLLGTVLLLDFPYKYLVESVICRIPFTLVNHHVGYFVMGHLLYQLWKEQKPRFSIGITVGFIVVGIVGSLAGDLVVMAQTGTSSVCFNSLFSLTLCITAIGIFGFLLKWPVRIEEKTAAMVNKLSQMTFGIYMIHPLVLAAVSDIVGSEKVNTIWGIPVVTIVVFLISLMIIWLLSLVPSIRKWVLFAGRRK